MVQKITFSFGKNWHKYLKEFYDQDKLNEAIKSLKQFMNIQDFKGKIFLDIGCGTGMFSLAAYKLGAKELISIDIDPYSVKCCNLLRKKENNPSSWKVLEGSILDKNIISQLLKADIVYSWGVLHHTGKMWEAISNTMNLVSPNGLLYIAIYNERQGLMSSKFWLKIKKLYNSVPDAGKLIMEYLFIIYFFTVGIIKMENRFKSIKNYKSKRGMSWRRDITDWLGGYPYEFAKAKKIIEFVKKRNFEILNLKNVKNGTGNNEFLFEKI